MKEVREDLSSFAERLTEAESRIGQAEDDISGLQGRVSKFEKTLLNLASALDLAECSSNIHILGLPNRVEGNNPVSFLENWLPQVLGADSFLVPVIIEQAHRLPSGNQAGNTLSRPKTVILKFLNYAGECWEQLGKEVQVMFQNHHIMLFPDLSPEVLKQQRRFDNMKRELRRRKIKYRIIFSAKLLVIYGDHRHLTWRFGSKGMVACWRDLTPNNVNPQKGMLQYKELFLFFSDEMWKFIELSWDSINVPNASRWVLCTQSFWRNHPLFMASNIFSYPYTLANMLNNRIHFKGKEQTICTHTNPNRTFCKRTPWGKTILF